MVNIFKHISVQDAWSILQDKDKSAVLLDIRDPVSFQQDHPQGALHLTDQTINQILDQVDYDQPIFLICYKGNSSQSAAQSFVDVGFSEVYSIDGGFTEWQKLQMPTSTGDK